MSPQEAVLRYYGLDKIAAPVAGALATGLRHGAYLAIPGAIVGGVGGFIHGGDDNPDGSSPTFGQRMGAAGKGALVGGAITGTAGGVGSGLNQRGYQGIRRVADRDRNKFHDAVYKRLLQLNKVDHPGHVTDAAMNALAEPTWSKALRVLVDGVRNPPPGITY